MLPLRRQAVIAGDNRPASGQLAELAAASVDHRLNGKQHARHQFHARAGFAVMQHLGIFMETLADAVPAELAHHGKAVRFRVLLNRVAHIAQGGP
ncbi:hypothetical protein G6F59_017858 [Rhizopus arrhizus]|nr:hypothetical protein G6F59_017858 [Rhizopus arrhizus]